MIGMAYRQPPTTARRIGFEIDPPADVTVQPHGATVRCREARADGATVGELVVEVFHAALVIDRDGILEEKVQAAIALAAPPDSQVLQTIPIELHGASGFRADVGPARSVASGGTAHTALPYVHVLAIAPDDLGVDGGLLVTVRSASPEWPAADKIVASLRILSRRSTQANDR
jgi:hypothetical protein